MGCILVRDKSLLVALQESSLGVHDRLDNSFACYAPWSGSWHTARIALVQPIQQPKIKSLPFRRVAPRVVLLIKGFYSSIDGAAAV